MTTQSASRMTQGIPFPSSPWNRIQLIGQYLIYIAIAAALIPFGTVHSIPKILLAIFISLILLVCQFFPIEKKAVRNLARDIWILLIAMVALVMIQSWKFEGNPFAHPIWDTAGELFDFDVGAISIEPSLSLYGLFNLVPPYFLVIAILHVFQKDEDLWRLMKFLAGLGSAFILYGIAQSQLFPSYVFIRELDSPKMVLTSTLINRNHAATVAGVTTLLCLAMVMRNSKNTNFFGFIIDLQKPQYQSGIKRTPILLWSALTFIAFIALFMTQSRGGLAATLLAWALITPGLVAAAIYDKRKNGSTFHSRAYNPIQIVSFTICTAIIVTGLLLIYAQGTLLRMADQTGESARFCNYPSMWQIFLDNWLFGTGFATFEPIFPQYRNLSCGASGVWTQAHNFWIEGFISFGIFFTAFAGFIIFRLFHIIWIGRKTRRSQRFLSTITFAIVILVSIHSYVEFSLQINGVAIFVATTLGTLCTLCLQRVAMKK